MGSSRQERDRNRGQVAARPPSRRGGAPGRNHRQRQGRRLPGSAQRLLQVRRLRGEEQSPPLTGSLIGPAPSGGHFFKARSLPGSSSRRFSSLPAPASPC